MKKTIFFSLILLNFFSFNVWSQSFIRSGSQRIDPVTILTDQYLVIPLPGQPPAGLKMNFLDSRNPYTYLDFLTDANNRVYHILTQTAFTGELICLAADKRLEKLLAGKNRPRLAFQSCLGRILEERSSLSIREAAIHCVLQQLGHPDGPANN